MTLIKSVSHYLVKILVPLEAMLRLKYVSTAVSESEKVFNSFDIAHNTLNLSCHILNF
jgi:hypothetical protein